MIEGLEANNLLNYDVTMTGYIGAESFLEKLVEVITLLKKKNPEMIYVCDPVMGDTDQVRNHRLYVKGVVRPFLKSLHQFLTGLVRSQRIASNLP